MSPRDSCCVATVWLKAFVLLLQARISVIFLFYNRSRVAPWIYLWVFIFKSAICVRLCFPKFGIEGWVKLPDTKGGSSFCNFRYFCFRASFLSLHLTSWRVFFYHLLRVASREQACIEIFNILFNVFHNKPHASNREFIGKFYHLFHGYSNKNLHFPCINIAKIHSW